MQPHLQPSLPTAEQVAMQRVYAAQTDPALTAKQQEAQTMNALTPEGPYQGPAKRLEAAERVAHYLMQNPPVVDAKGAQQWVQGVYASPTTHSLAQRAERGANESYTSYNNAGERVMDTLIEAVKNDPTVTDTNASLNTLGKALIAPVVEAPRNDKPMPHGAKAMATQVIKRVRKTLEQQRGARTMRTAENLGRVAAQRVSEARVTTQAGAEYLFAQANRARQRIDFRTLTETQLSVSANDIKRMGENARQYVHDLVGRYGGKLPQHETTQLVDAAKRMAYRSVVFARELPGIGDSVRARLDTMVVKLNGGSAKHEITHEAIVAVGEQIRAAANQKLTEKEALRPFSRNPERAALEASQLVVGWADQQSQGAQTLEQEATRRAYQQLAQSIGNGVNGEPYLKATLKELAPERNYLTAADRSINHTVDELRKVIAPAVVQEVKHGAKVPVTALDVVAKSKTAASATERAMVVDQLINLTPEETLKLERARQQVARRVAREEPTPANVSQLEQFFHANPEWRNADMTLRGQRVTALANQWREHGEHALDPADVVQQHHGAAQVVKAVGRTLNATEKQQLGLGKNAENFRVQTEQAAQKAAQERVQAQQEQARNTLRSMAALKEQDEVRVLEQERARQKIQEQVLRPNDGLIR